MHPNTKKLHAVVPFNLFNKLGEDALYLCILRAIGDNTKHKTDDGWFRCTHQEFLEVFTCAKQHKHMKIIQRLEAGGYIETERRGFPNERWIRVNEELIK